jgi:hypothetical protein
MESVFQEEEEEQQYEDQPSLNRTATFKSEVTIMAPAANEVDSDDTDYMNK